MPKTTEKLQRRIAHLDPDYKVPVKIIIDPDYNRTKPKNIRFSQGKPVTLAQKKDQSGLQEIVNELTRLKIEHSAFAKNEKNPQDYVVANLNQDEIAYFDSQNYVFQLDDDSPII
jgi:hypothetical protein